MTGNWDLVGNNTPIFFIRDPILFPSFIHTQKRNPATHLKDPDAMWDFITLRPETTHQVIYTNSQLLRQRCDNAFAVNLLNIYIIVISVTRVIST